MIDSIGSGYGQAPFLPVLGLLDCLSPLEISKSTRFFFDRIVAPVEECIERMYGSLEHILALPLDLGPQGTCGAVPFCFLEWGSPSIGVCRCLCLDVVNPMS